MPEARTEPVGNIKLKLVIKKLPSIISIMKKIFYYQLLALCVGFSFSPTNCFGQKNEANNNAQCLKEKKDLKYMEEELEDTKNLILLNDGLISNTQLHLQSYIKNPKLGTSQKQIDFVLNALGKEIALLKEKIKNSKSNEDYSKLTLISRQGKYDFFAEQRLKTQFGESVDPKNNDLLKTIATLEGKRAEMKNSEKTILNDIQLTKDRLSNLKCESLTTNSSSANPGYSKLAGILMERPGQQSSFLQKQQQNISCEAPGSMMMVAAVGV